LLKESPIRTKYKPEVEKELQHIEDKDEQDIARNLMKIAKRFASAQSEATRGFSRFCRLENYFSIYAFRKSDECFWMRRRVLQYMIISYHFNVSFRMFPKFTKYC